MPERPAALVPPAPGPRVSDYRSEIFWTTDEQRQVAQETIAAADRARVWPGRVVTKISEGGPFWAA